MKKFIFTICISVILFSSNQAQQVYSKTLSSNLQVDAILRHSNGTFYGTGGWNGPQLKKISPNGTVSNFTSISPGIVDIVWGDNDTIIGTSYQNGRIMKISPDGSSSVLAYSSTGVASLFRDDNGDYLCAINPGLAHPSSGTVIRIKPSGQVSTFASGGSINKPSGVAKDDEGNYYISNLGDGRITKIDTAGNKTHFATVPAIGTWKIGYIRYWKGALFTTAISENTIYKTTLNGESDLYAGNGDKAQVDGPALEASFKTPNGIAVNGDTLFIISGVETTNKLRYIVDNQTTSVGANNKLQPDGIILEQNYPNPFNPTTTISFSIPNTDKVSLEIFNSIGEKINTLADKEFSAGKYSFKWNADNHSSGIYFYSLTTSQKRITNKMIVLK